MTNQEVEASLVKAATIGVTQSLINRGATLEQAQALALEYAHPTEGLFAKRAAAVANMKENVATIINAMRGY